MKAKVTVYEVKSIRGTVLIIGTLNEIRKWVKNEWSDPMCLGYILDVFGDINEEDFYLKMDDDLTLISHLEGQGDSIKPLCDVPFDDFYDEEKPSQELIDEVLEQIKKDVAGGDVTAIEELLMHVPLSKLGGYLPE